MLIVIGIIAAIVIIGVIRGVLSVKNQPDLDANGTMHCKACGSTTFNYWRNNDGSTTYECNYCGKRWTRL